MQFSSRGIRPRASTMMARHLDKNTTGYLQWRYGSESAMTSSIVRDTKTSHFTLALQVRSQYQPELLGSYWIYSGLYYVCIYLYIHYILYQPFVFVWFQLGMPHSYLMMSYQYKFQDEDQTKVKGSVK